MLFDLVHSFEIFFFFLLQRKYSVYSNVPTIISFFLKIYCFFFFFTAALPVDPVQENYVRQVRDCIFSVAYPTPFKSRVLLVAISKVRF